MKWIEVPRDSFSQWFDAIQEFVADTPPQVRPLCPVCRRSLLRAYWQLYSTNDRRAASWVWCPGCGAFQHYSGWAPVWWQPVEMALNPMSELDQLNKNWEAYYVESGFNDESI